MQRLALQLTPAEYNFAYSKGSNAQLQCQGWDFVDVLEAIGVMSSQAGKRPGMGGSNKRGLADECNVESLGRTL
jgi:hypothetical protein